MLSSFLTRLGGGIKDSVKKGFDPKEGKRRLDLTDNSGILT